jgi:hypothetical protein
VVIQSKLGGVSDSTEWSCVVGVERAASTLRSQIFERANCFDALHAIECLWICDDHNILLIKKLPTSLAHQHLCPASALVCLESNGFFSFSVIHCVCV